MLFMIRPLRYLCLRAIEKSETDLKVGILSGGSSDEGVVNEAYYTLLYMGVNAKAIHDIGVAGMHRLMDRVEEIKIVRYSHCGGWI